MAQLNFNATTVAPNSGQMDPVPAGWYHAQIDQSQMKPTGDGSGQYLELRFNVIDGQYVGRKLFHRLNLQNQNQQAVDIAYGQLSAICHAVNVLNCVDSQMLHGIPLKIKASVRKGGAKVHKETGQPTGEFYEDSNDVKAFANINDPNAGAAAPTPVAQPGPGGFPQQGFPAQQQPQGFAQPQQGFQQPQQPAAQPWAAMQPQQPQPGAPQGLPPAAQPAQPWAQQPAQPPAQQPVQQAAQAPQATAPTQPWQQAQQPAPQQPWQQQAAQPMQQQPAQQPWAQQPQQPAANVQQAVPPWAQQPTQ